MRWLDFDRLQSGGLYLFVRIPVRRMPDVHWGSRFGLSVHTGGQGGYASDDFASVDVIDVCIAPFGFGPVTVTIAGISRGR